MKPPTEYHVGQGSMFNTNLHDDDSYPSMAMCNTSRLLCSRFTFVIDHVYKFRSALLLLSHLYGCHTAIGAILYGVGNCIMYVPTMILLHNDIIDNETKYKIIMVTHFCIHSEA